MSRRGRDERGVTVVLAVGLAAVLVLVGAGSVGTEAIVIAHRRAQVAADLASLAGAGALRSGADACAAAQRIATGHATRLTGCVVEGLTVLVQTEATLPAALGGAGMAARSRAGPAPPR